MRILNTRDRMMNGLKLVQARIPGALYCKSGDCRPHTTSHPRIHVKSLLYNYWLVFKPVFHRM